MSLGLPLDSASRSYRSANLSRHRLRKFEILALASVLLQTAGLAQSPLVLDAETRAGAVIERNVEAGRPDTSTFQLEARQFFHVVIEQGKADLSVTFFDPEGRAARTVDARWSGAEPASFEAPASGSYRMEIRRLQPTPSPWSYTLKVSPIRQGVAEDEKQLSAESVSTHIKSSIAANTREAKEKALAQCETALQLWRAVGDRVAEAQTLNTIGYLRNELGNPKEALSFYERALALRRELGDRSAESETLHNIAAAYSLIGDKSKALEIYQQALDLRLKLRDFENCGITLTNMGSVYASIGELSKAVESLDRAVSLLAESGNRVVQIQASANLAATYVFMSENQKALDLNLRILPVARQIGDIRGEAYILLQIGRIYDELGDPEKAIANSEPAASLMTRIGDSRGEAGALTNIGSVYFGQGQLSKARDFYTRAMAVAEKTRDPFVELPLLLNMARLDDALGERDRALEMNEHALERARAVDDIRSQSAALRNLAEIQLREGNPRKALEYLELALPLFRRTGFGFGQANTLLAMARARAALGQLQEARSASEEALSLVESARSQVSSTDLRSSYFASKQAFFRFHIDLLMRMHKSDPSRGYDAAALNTSERARARGLLDLLKEASLSIRSGIDSELHQQEESVQHEINYLASRLMSIPTARQTEPQRAVMQKQLDTALGKLDTLETRIRVSNPRYASLTQPRPLTVPEIQSLLQPDVALIEYAFGEEHSYAWVVKAGSIQVFELEEESKLSAAAGRLLEAVNRPRRAWDTEAVALSSLLIRPLRGALQGSKQLIVVADGALLYVPFGLLSAEKAPLLGTSHQISYLPSASIVPSLARNAGKPRRYVAAVFADPVFHESDDRVAKAKQRQMPQRTANDALERSARQLLLTSEGLRLPRLRFSREEARAIELLAPKKTFIRLDFAANRGGATSSALQDSGILHFATHTLINNQHPELSGIVLSLLDEHGKPSDGFLRLHEIYNLDIPADLVVLSSCESGLGKQVRGEGLIGFTRGFFYAGASRVLVTLWKVNDEATAAFMRHFYRQLLGNHLPPAAALQAAQASMRQSARWSSPYYWAGFVLQGEWQ